MAQARIALLVQWELECPELANVRWLEVLCALVAHVCQTFHVDAAQMIPRCGKTPEDLAIEACEDFALRNIAWEEGRVLGTAGVIALLKRVVARDYLDQAFVRRNGKRVLRPQISLDATTPIMATTDQGADSILLARTGTGIIEQLLEGMARTPDHHPNFPAFVELHLTQPDIKPREIALALNLSITVVYGMRKRLERRLRQVVPPEDLAGRLRANASNRRRQRRPHA